MGFVGSLKERERYIYIHIHVYMNTRCVYIYMCMSVSVYRWGVEGDDLALHMSFGSSPPILFAQGPEPRQTEPQLLKPLSTMHPPQLLPYLDLGRR